MSLCPPPVPSSLKYLVSALPSATSRLAFERSVETQVPTRHAAPVFAAPGETSLTMPKIPTATTTAATTTIATTRPVRRGAVPTTTWSGDGTVQFSPGTRGMGTSPGPGKPGPGTPGPGT